MPTDSHTSQPSPEVAVLSTSSNFSARILMRPKIAGIHIGSYKTNKDPGKWAKGQSDQVDVLVVEPDHVHVGCVVSFGNMHCSLFFDPSHDHLCFSNDSMTNQSAIFLRSEGTHGQGSHGDNNFSQIRREVTPFAQVNLEVGVWSLALAPDKVFMEIEVLGRKPWKILQPSKSGEQVESQSGSGNALVELRREEAITIGVGKTYWLKRLNTLYDQPTSTVWTAESTMYNTRLSGHTIAVKVLKPGFEGDLIRKAQAWKNEVETHAVVSGHPSIVRLLGFDARFHSIYTEHIDAKSLLNFFRSDASFTGTRADALRIMQDISSALAHVHSKQKVHGDVKPENILFSRERGAVLIDFGSSFSCGRPLLPSEESPWYLPPEYAEDWELRDAPSDVWALGIVGLWLVGRIQLPESYALNWNVSDATSITADVTSHDKARSAMDKWLECVKKARAKLREENELEAIIIRILDYNKATRINAASLHMLLAGLPTHLMYY
ncbi:kinase-like domain-containing protein [Astrocystis sublimbata]|nr:kinase-like domain-containing protein [Astrocystis sublimbata]